jgi:hypothetical protein
MSKPRKRWWGYVRRVLYDYPRIHPETATEQREKTAVEAAVEETQAMPDGEARLRLVGAVFFAKTHTLQGAAMREHLSYHTAQRIVSRFVRLTGKKMGLE